MKSLTYLLLIICTANNTFAQSSGSLEQMTRKEIRDLIMNQTEDPMAAGLMHISHRKCQAATAATISGMLLLLTATAWGSNMDTSNGDPSIAGPFLVGMTGLTTAIVGVGLSASSESKFNEAKSHYLIAKSRENIPNMTLKYTPEMTNRELSSFLMNQDKSIKAKTVVAGYQKHRNITNGLMAVTITSLLIGLASDSGLEYWGSLSGASFFGWAMADRKSKRILDEAEEIYQQADLQTLGGSVFIRDESKIFNN